MARAPSARNRPPASNSKPLFSAPRLFNRSRLKPALSPPAFLLLFAAVLSLFALWFFWDSGQARTCALRLPQSGENVLLRQSCQAHQCTPCLSAASGRYISLERAAGCRFLYSDADLEYVFERDPLSDSPERLRCFRGPCDSLAAGDFGFCAPGGEARARLVCFENRTYLFLPAPGANASKRAGPGCPFEKSN